MNLLVRRLNSSLVQRLIHQLLPANRLLRLLGWLVFMLLSDVLSAQSQVYNTSGTFTVPEGVNSITVQAIGGGGGGGNSASGNRAGGGGGAFATKTFPVIPGAVYIVLVGAGGMVEMDGGSSSFGAEVIAVGGKGGVGLTGAAGGAAADCTPAADAFSGGAGGGSSNAGGVDADAGGGGGGAATVSNNGRNGAAGTNTTPGQGGLAGGGGGTGGGAGGAGDGGAGADDFGGSTGQNGFAPGGGGGGRSEASTSGGNGATGRITVAWACAGVDMTNFSVSATTPVCALHPTTVTLTSSTLADGTYLVYYNLSGANTGTGQSASVTFSGGAGTFTTGALPTSGNTNIHITSVGCANLANNSCTVSVQDNPMPTLTCPANQVLTAGVNQCSTTPFSYSVTTTDFCPATISLVSGLPSGAPFPIGMTTTVWQATNIVGDMTTCQFVVTVTDNQIPSIVCPTNLTKGTDPNQCTAVIHYAIPMVSDNCAGWTLMRTSGVNTASGSAFPKGITMVNWEVTDASGNAAVCGFTVTVTDDQAPSITCPVNVVKNTEVGQCSASVTYASPIYADNCTGGGLQYISGGASGSIFQKRTTSVIWQATDGAGLTQRCTFTVTINDNQLPVITCPANQTKNTNAGQCTAVTTYPTPTVTDNCPGGNVTIQSGLISGSAFPKGINTVVWKATDAAGLTKTCSFRVTVNDGQAPVMTCPTHQVKTTDVNGCTAVATYNPATFTDNCNGGTVVKLSGLNSGAAFPKGANQVVFKATDAAGNQSLCTMTITVTDAQLPTVTCPANIAVTGTTANGICSAPVNYTTPTALDNCALQSSWLWSGLASGSVFPEGVTTNVWRATDEGGLTATCAFTVTVSCSTSQGTMNKEQGTRNDEVANRLSFLKPGTDLTTLSRPVSGSNLTLRMAPNPAITEVQITIEGLTDSGGQLTLFDAQGRVVWQQSNVQHPISTLHVSSLPSGLYQVRLQTEHGVVTKPLVVSRL